MVKKIINRRIGSMINEYKFKLEDEIHDKIIDKVDYLLRNDIRIYLIVGLRDMNLNSSRITADIRWMTIEKLRRGLGK